MEKKRNRLPKGWTEAKVRRLLRHYESQSPEAAAEEDRRALKRPRSSNRKSKL